MLRVLAIIALVAAPLRADAPPGYYDSAANLTGAALKAALHDIVDDHTVIPYEDLFPPIKALWEAPGDPSRVRLIYGGATAPKSSFSWNREHLWPRSRGVNPGAAMNGGVDDSDLFNVVPADADVNGARSNLYFDESSPGDGNYSNPAHPEAPLCSKDANSWEPPDAEKGDIARSLFYMAVRYDGSDANTTDLELVTGTPSGAQMANLPTLLAWHAADPPDAAEMARNDLIYSVYQHNRNPFIDHPEWVQEIWGSTASVTVQAVATAPVAYEAPSNNGVITITLGSPAPPGGLVVAFAISGTASSADHTLSGTGVSFSPGTGNGTATFAAGASVVTITIVPVADGIEEAAESVVLTLSPGAGHSVIGGAAQVTISDAPPPPGSGVIAVWNFNAVPFTSTSIAPSNGSGTLSTSAWGGSVTNFGGLNGTQALALVREAGGNGTHIQLSFSAAGWTGLFVTYQTRRSGTGFTTGTWSWSTDGSAFTPVAGNYAPVNADVFEPREVDFSGVAGLRNAPVVTLRYTLAGATSNSGNCRIEDLVIRGARYSSAWLARFPSADGTHGADVDGDARNAFVEWAADTDPHAPTAPDAVASGFVFAPDPDDGGVIKQWPTFTFTRRLDAPHIAYTPQQATVVGGWTGGCVLVGTAPGPSPQSERATFRATTPAGAGGVFFRLLISE